ncbi:MAG: nicotinate phosphoribosyltransferase [Deferribacterales bacterium]
MLLDKHIGLYTDLYELTMAQGYFLTGKINNEAVFDYFFRSSPFCGSYVVFAGLEDLFDYLENFRFDNDDLEYLKSLNFKEDFLKFLKNLRFTGTIYSVKEGEIVFPYEPILRIHGNLIETQLLETIVLNTLNFQSLIATKASRLKIASKGKPVIDFGLRRAQGLGGIAATRAAAIGGADMTSNVLGAMLYEIPPSGTMAHSWIQSFDDEIKAFREFAKIYGEKTILLIDTYDTIKSGLFNAIKVAKEMELEGKRILGIRLDSGDLVELSRHCRKILDENGLNYIKIVVSNMLDEFIIDEALSQGAPIDIFGVGTKLSAGKDDAALDGVYKLISIDGKPKIKISNNPEKVLLPDIKNIVRFKDNDKFKEDKIVLEKLLQTDKGEILLNKMFEKGKRIFPKKSISDIKKYSNERLLMLPEPIKRIKKPIKYNVKVCNTLLKLKNQIIADYFKEAI